MIDPDTADTANQALGWAAKIGSLLAAFVAGIVTTTWAVATKVKGYDAEIKALKEEQERIARCIDRKLDRLHERIDELMLACGTPKARSMVRKGEPDDD